MTDMTDPRLGATRTLFHKIPVIGWVARDISRHDDDVWYLLVAVLSLLVIGVATWGVQVLAMAALAMVPVMLCVLILITRG